MSEQPNAVIEIKTEGKDLNVRYGELPNPINISEITYEGDIYSVKNYITGKKLDNENPEVKSYDTVIEIDSDARKISLEIYSSLPDSRAISGRLKLSKEFEQFKIETRERWSMASLKQLIRTTRPYFPDKDAHGKLLTNLGKIDMQINELIKKEDDDRGNSVNLVETKIVSNIDERFTLAVPIFRGLPVNTFEVNILMERRDKGVSLWLESVEALEISKDIWDKLKESETAFFLERGFTVINQ